jgi:hypothetical protein
VTRGLAAALLLGTAASAQDLSIAPPSRPGDPPSADGVEAAPAPAGSVASAGGGTMRVLDKINGTFTDLDLTSGETVEVGSLTVTLGECRYPADNPAGDAFALVSIRAVKDDAAVFEGWMIASSPALSAMDHPRYDVWALRCQGT